MKMPGKKKALPILPRAFHQDEHGIIQLQELRDVSSHVKAVAKRLL